MLSLYEYELDVFREGQEYGGPRVHNGYTTPARAETLDHIVFN